MKQKEKLTEEELRLKPIKEIKTMLAMGYTGNNHHILTKIYYEKQRNELANVEEIIDFVFNSLPEDVQEDLKLLDIIINDNFVSYYQPSLKPVIVINPCLINRCRLSKKMQYHLVAKEFAHAILKHTIDMKKEVCVKEAKELAKVWGFSI